MKSLFEILNGIKTEAITGSQTVEIQGITADSREVKPGFLFVAIKGTTTDGHDFIEKAIEKGATAILAERLPTSPPSGGPGGAGLGRVIVADSSAALGLAAANFYNRPAEKLTLIAVTGTNGKTTVTTLLWQLFTKIGHKCGLIGTVENRIGDKTVAATHTTPDPVSLQKLLAEMVEAGCSHVFMEVSSHAIAQKRVAGLPFAGALFTNLTHDHLDYHQTFEAYREAKKQLFDHLPPTAFALTNADDRNGSFMLQNTKAAKTSFGLKKMAPFKAKILENSLSGLHLQMDGVAIHCRLVGEFNASNLAAVYATARLLGIEKMEALTALSDLTGAEGRFETIVSPKTGIVGIVDYAHTPDALEKILETIQKLKKAQKLKSSTAGNFQIPNSEFRIPNSITVVGCGGDRDKTKRPIMAAIAARLSDHLILTSDNPRTEDPNQILNDMEAGLTDPILKQKTLTIADRRQAIRTACQLAKPGDVILVAGKGHEKYQEIMGVKHPFDDREILEECLT